MIPITQAKKESEPIVESKKVDDILSLQEQNKDESDDMSVFSDDVSDH